MANQWTADSQYIMEDIGEICVIGGRTYTKVNQGIALVAIYDYNKDGSWRTPLIISNNADAVSYGTNHDETIFSYSETIERYGITWYISGMNYFMGANNSYSGYAKKIDGVFSDNITAAYALMDTANLRMLLNDVSKIQLKDESLYNVKDTYSRVNKLNKNEEDVAYAPINFLKGIKIDAATITYNQITDTVTFS